MSSQDQTPKPRIRRKSAKAIRPSKLIEQHRFEGLKRSYEMIHHDELESRDSEWEMGLKAERDFTEALLHQSARMGGKADFFELVIIGVVLGGLSGALLGWGPLSDPRFTGVLAGGIVAAVSQRLDEHLWTDRIRSALNSLRSWWRERGSRPSDSWEE
jgi:hypothetical protein